MTAATTSSGPRRHFEDNRTTRSWPGPKPTNESPSLATPTSANWRSVPVFLPRAALSFFESSGRINLSTVFAGQNVGVKEVDEKVWLISFMHYDLGFFDHESNRFECAESPFGAKVLPMSSV